MSLHHFVSAQQIFFFFFFLCGSALVDIVIISKGWWILVFWENGFVYFTTDWDVSHLTHHLLGNRQVELSHRFPLKHDPLIVILCRSSVFAVNSVFHLNVISSQDRMEKQATSVDVNILGFCVTPNFHWIWVHCVAALIQFCSAVRQPAIPTAQYGGQLVSQGRGVPAIIT